MTLQIDCAAVAHENKHGGGKKKKKTAIAFVAGNANIVLNLSCLNE